MTTDLLVQLDTIEVQGAEAVAGAESPAELEQIRIDLLGRKTGRLSGILRQLGSLPAEQRGEIGARANRVKQALSAALESRAEEVAGRDHALAGRPAAKAGAVKAARASAGRPETDLTLPGRSRWQGGRHPVSQVVEEICDIFRDLGFSRVAGPEIETVENNFVKLNTPLDHPAADMHDTFYLAEDIVLRTHTSPAQARVMERYAPPIRVVVPGVVYRRETVDASHAAAFEQIEGLAVDEGITFVDFKATITEFVRRFFGAEARTRFRPSFFPFTEPSAEVDVSCLICGGAGCSACKGTGWMEIMGAGMVDPAVFENVGYDPERYTGFAFGMGPMRIAMLRYRIPDIRLLHENDVRFLEQFV